MRSAGTYISGIGHAGLIAWLALGWGFDSEPLPFEITEVSVVSGEEYAQLVRATTPDPSTADPDTLVSPVVDETPPPPEPEETQEPLPTPEPVEQPAEETPPPEAPEPPAPVAEVADEVPEVTSPDFVEQPEIAEPITEDPPNSRQTDVIAPLPTPEPEPDTPVSVDTTPAVIPEDAPEDPPIDEVEEPTAAPDTSTTTTVENEEVSGAPEKSIRPTSRPNRPEPAEVVEAPEEPAEPVAEDSTIDDLLADVVGSGEAAPANADAPEGPPMTGSEKDSFRVAVNACWNVDTGSEASRVSVVVGFSLAQNGKVEGNVRQISTSGGSDAAVRSAFQAARRAILRCQGNGYQLPADKYGQWKDVEITFDPSGMRLR